jgi:hypothetical protein
MSVSESTSGSRIEAPQMAKKQSLKVIAEFSFEKHFWARPDYDGSRIGECTDRRIFEAVGRALTEWERAEESLHYLYSIVCGVPQSSDGFDNVMRGFGAIENTLGRVAAVRQAGTIYFDPWWHIAQVDNTFTELLKSVQFGARRRNDIAHGKVTRICTYVQKGSPVDLDTGYLLLAPRYMSGRTNPFPSSDEGDRWAMSKSQYACDRNDIRTIADKFLKLANMLADFANQSTRYPETAAPHFIKKLLEANPKYSARRKRRALGPP